MKLAEQLEVILQNRIAQDSLTLPLLPAIATKASEVAGRADAGSKDWAAILELDPILAALGMRQGVSAGCRTLDQVVTKLEEQKIRTLLTEASARKVVESRDPKTAEATRLHWEHARAVAIMAQKIATLVGVEEPEVCYVAGLLHDIGKPVVATMLLEAEAQIAQRKPKLWIDVVTWIGVVERTHRRIAVDLAKKWQFPEDIQGIMLPFADFDAVNKQSISNAVHFANALAKQLGIYVGAVASGANDALVTAGRALLGIDDEGIAQVTADIKTRCRLT